MAGKKSTHPRVNAPLFMVTGNPPRKIAGERISKSVVALAYVREDNGGTYVHGFGNADITPSEVKGELRIKGLKRVTRVCMEALPDGSIRLYSMDGKSLWKEFPDGSA